MRQQGRRWVSSFAGRVPVGFPIPVLSAKKGPYHQRYNPETGDEEEVMVVGAACSECFTGPRLAKVLRNGFEYESKALESLEAQTPSSPLSIHTSVGVPPVLPEFIQQFAEHMPWKAEVENTDWFMNLQVEGASAVHGAIDLMLQMQHMHLSGASAPSSSDGIFAHSSSKRRMVAVGEESYHGPPSSSFGSATPLGNKPMQLSYPVPAYFKRRTEDNETVEEFHGRMKQEFELFLSQHGDEIGVMLFEPQSGSSLAAQPWDRDLLREYIRLAKKEGIKVIADEIMCGLGRHGQGTLFLSESWDLEPDVVTFGKAVAAGVFPLAGCIVRQGAREFSDKKRSVMQSHTYAGSNTRALLTAMDVLNMIKDYHEHIGEMGDLLAEQMHKAADASGGAMVAHGMGLMWGLAWSRHSCATDAELRARANVVMKEVCQSHKIWPYFVGCGIMVTPAYDIQKHEVIQLGDKLASAVAEISRQFGWRSTTVSQMSF